MRPDSDIPEELGVQIARTAVEVLESAGEIPGLASLKLCPYCLISSLLGLPRDLNYSGKSRKYEDSDYDVLVDKLNSILALGATAGWLKAAAALHNKEVHALNGNIDSLRVVRNTGERPKVVEALRNVFWYSPVFSSKRGGRLIGIYSMLGYTWSLDPRHRPH